MADVAEVAALPAVTRVPGSPAWLAGVANWRGRMLPVLDLRPLLGPPACPLASQRPPGRRCRPAATSSSGLVAEAVPGVYDGASTTWRRRRRPLPADAGPLRLGQVTDALGPDRRARRRGPAGAARPGRPPPPRLSLVGLPQPQPFPRPAYRPGSRRPMNASDALAAPGGQPAWRTAVEFWKKLNGASTVTLAVTRGRGGLSRSR